MKDRNLINSECEIHGKMNEYMCCYSKCAKNLICEKCRREHLQIHPAQFIYELSNIAEIHSFNKIDKLKEILMKEKIYQKQLIQSIYNPYITLVNPLAQSVKAFARQSRELIQNELKEYLRSNKYMIDDANKDIKKTDTRAIKDDPNQMLVETINEAEIINRKQARILENGQNYKWYADSTREMCAGIVVEVKAMIQVAVSLINNSIALQRNKFIGQGIQFAENHHQMSFYKRYNASNQVGIKQVELEKQILSAKKMLDFKEDNIAKSRKEVRDKVIKISELEETVDGLRQQLQALEQKLERQERERRAIVEREKQKKKELLITNGIIGSNRKSICFDRKQIDENLILLILQLVPQPISIDLSNHKLTPSQLQLFMECTSIQILKYNFTPYDIPLFIKLFRSYPNLNHIEFNSVGLTDQIIELILSELPVRLRVLYIIDNNITDDGMDKILNRVANLQQLYVSFNKLSSRSLDSIGRMAQYLKVLHIAKNNLKQKGGNTIGKILKELQELFIGSTGISKEGFLAICKNCSKLKRLSLSANEITTEVVTEIMLELQSLEWLDLSYCNFEKRDIEKFEKLKIYNKSLTIVYNG